MTKDLEEIGEVAHHGPEDLFIAVMTFLGAFALMFAVNADLALITALVVPPMPVSLDRYGNRDDAELPGALRPGRGLQRADRGECRRHAGRTGVRQRGRTSAAVRRDNDAYRRTKLEGYRLMAASPRSLTFDAATQMVVMVAGTWFVLHGELSPGGFVGFLLLVGVFFRPVEKINAVLETYPKGIAGFRRYCELIDTEPTLTDLPSARAAPPLAGDIVYERVTFGYAPQGCSTLCSSSGGPAASESEMPHDHANRPVMGA